ncbi:hypothetical protein [Ligilactobacillus acidipiscis]|jgi:hypothetical protein|uniref:Uncharacterized protein n=1 Tax=Ligilactobacillus acidipiscis TaxID=89059 RepID=A0A1K1KKY3_9LACO|nr:hypothetical protein [Ligilactobacillus acidipiscis]MCI1953620.1 hypothetical protein [Ligilactobacillus acidipiscis]GAW65057.1 hypothetical protein Lacidipiscis_02285 [Ligilactobacillus acidipiscis]SFV39572.1 hypothetical protein LAC1533_0152 [Ligilactobacillus acidipiscis]
MMSQENSILDLLNIQDPNIEISVRADAVEGALHTKELLPGGKVPFL